VTVNVGVTLPFLMLNEPLWSTVSVSCLFAACGWLPLLV
jgi:hypothetical protein